MSTRSPKERLEKFFHKRQSGSKDELQQSSPPPASSSAGGGQRQARKTSSRSSLRDMFQSKREHRRTTEDIRRL